VERGKSDIDVSNDFWEVIGQARFSSKGEPVGMIENA